MKPSQRKQKTYSVDVHGGGEFDVVPTRAKFTITRSEAEDILRLSRTVKLAKCHSIESFNYSVTYQGEDVRTDLNILHVSATAFHFSANVKHTDIQFSTEPVQLTDMVKYFGLCKVSLKITQEDITALMADLRHFCKQNQLSFAHSHRISEEQYLAEISGKE